jgi:pimeloyl-ACP methyl ester carboxylesterase
MPLCFCKDAQIHFETEGTGPPLLFISGLGGGTWSWQNQVPYFRSFYTTITFDNRGAGGSSISHGPYHMKHFATDALCLLDHLEVERTFVVGLSMGGMIALELAILAPERVTALVLGCTHCGGDMHKSPDPGTLAVLLNNEGLSREEIVEKNIPLFIGEECRKERPALVEAYRKWHLASPEQPEYAFMAQLGAIRTYDCSKRISGINLPTLIVTGSEDVLVPRENAYILSKAIRGSQVVEIPGAGHALHAECSDLLNALIHDFFRRHEGTGEP